MCALGLTTVESRKNPFELIFALDSELTARGQLFYDDGESLDTLSAGTYFLGMTQHISDKVGQKLFVEFYLDFVNNLKQRMTKEHESETINESNKFTHSKTRRHTFGK
jgi:hypothetical protein